MNRVRSLGSIESETCLHIKEGLQVEEIMRYIQRHEKLWHGLRITRIQMKHMTSYPTLHPSSFKSDSKDKAVQESGRKKKLEKQIWHRFCVAFYTVLRSWEKI